MVSATDMPDNAKPDPKSPYLLRRPPLHRAIVLAAGPGANLLLGFLVIASLYVGFGRPVVPPVVREVVAGGAAEQAGIRPGDRFLSVNGVRTHSFGDIFSEISLRLDEPAVARIARGTEELTIRVQPRVERITGIGGTQSIGRIGIVSGDPVHETVGPIDALIYGAGDVWKQTRAFVIAVKQLFIGTRPISEVGGPIKMAEVTSQAISDGIANFVFIIAAFSINLAVVNLVPLPVLDGGQLLICAIEGIVRRPLNAKFLVGIQAVGVVLLLALMTTLTINDLWALFSKA
jgi:regulator of sigma E protease